MGRLIPRQRDRLVSVGATTAPSTDICVIYLSDDEVVCRRLITLLRERWSVWSAHDMVHGDWEREVRGRLSQTRAVVALLSGALAGDRGAIIKDEMRLAARLGKPVLPFIIGEAEVPMGFGDHDHTRSNGWSGDPRAEGFQRLLQKIAAALSQPHVSNISRPESIAVGAKALELPTFVASISSFETRLPPGPGLALLRGLEPRAALLSAYDAAGVRNPRSQFARDYRHLRRTPGVLFLDSGNYEASRRADYKTRTNPDGWSLRRYRDAVTRYPPDVAFHFDDVSPTGNLRRVIRETVAAFRADQEALGASCCLCPIIHLPSVVKDVGRSAAEAVTSVAAAVDPVLVAIPERELGDGLKQRFLNILRIRSELNSLGKYIPLHLLGTGNPLSMAAFAAAGADIFDGLEWCRTVADYRTGELFHFQHFDMVGEPSLSRLSNQRARALARDPATPYATRALAYNFDFFEDWSKTMRDLIRSGQERVLLNYLPDIGPSLHALLQETTPGSEV